MRLFNNFFHMIQLPSFQAEGHEGSSVAEMIDLMGNDDNPDESDEKVITDSEADLLKDDKKEKKDDDKEEKEEKIELKEGETEEEEEPELSEEELEDVGEFSRKDFLKAYPDAFKKFPMLEKAFYREQQYAEVFPTISDAKSAAEEMKVYEGFKEGLFKGNVTSVLTSLKETDNNAFTKVVDNYLDDLRVADKDAYYHVIGNTFKNGIVSMVNEANRIKGESGEKLREAALIVHQYLFGTSEWKAPETFSKAPVKNEDQERLNSEKREFLQTQFDSALEDVSTRTKNIIRHTIAEHIDPKESMTDYVKRVAINEALDAVESAIDSDTRFKAQLDKLWEKAFENRFNRASMDNIRKAYLNKAKTLLPQYIQKSRNAALKGLGKRVTENKEEPIRKGPVAANRPATGRESGNNNSKTVPRGMKTLDYLNSED